MEAPRSRSCAHCGRHSRGEARSITHPDGHYGQTLISRWPLVPRRCTPSLSVQRHEPRRAIKADIDTPVRRAGASGRRSSRLAHARAGAARQRVAEIVGRSRRDHRGGSATSTIGRGRGSVRSALAREALPARTRIGLSALWPLLCSTASIAAQSMRSCAAGPTGQPAGSRIICR